MWWLQGGSEGERGCGACRAPPHRWPNTNAGRSAGEGAPLRPPTAAPGHILPRVGLTLGPPRRLWGWLGGGTRAPVQHWPSPAGPGRGHSVGMVVPTHGREQTRGDGQTPQAQPPRHGFHPAPSTTPTSPFPKMQHLHLCCCHEQLWAP